MLDRLFLSVGAMKAGTTWLHQNLAGHPAIYFSPEKEIHYFADPDAHTYMSLAHRTGRYQQVVRNLKPERINAQVQRNLAWYGSHYLAPTINDHWYTDLFAARTTIKPAAPYVADFSNLYVTLDAAGWAHVRRVARTVRAIYTMRHPAKRLWSQFKFSYEFSGRGHELATIGKDALVGFLNDDGNRLHADYAGAIARLRTHLAPEEIHFFFFEDVHAKPLDTLRSIEAFLDIDAHSYNEGRFGKTVNPSTSMAIPTAFADGAEKIRVEQIVRLTDLGFNVPDSWHTPFFA
ncbi:MAG: sulfotransferase [Pseudomonadota bacterium]